MWCDWSTSWQPLSSSSECLSTGDAMPCLLWAAVIWVRSIATERLSVWLHSSLLSAGQTRRSPQYRPEHTHPGDNWRSTWGKVNTSERAWERKEKTERRKRPGQLQSTTILWIIIAIIPCSLPQLVNIFMTQIIGYLAQSLKAELLQTPLN